MMLLLMMLMVVVIVMLGFLAHDDNTSDCREVLN
jgi:hypothetical protein